MMSSAASLGAGVAAGLAGLDYATRQVSLSTARLATNNRLVHAGDDVAAMSIAGGLQSQVTTLRAAQVNNSQANSLIQVATDGLSNIYDSLNRMSAIATQGTNPSLTAGEQA